MFRFFTRLKNVRRGLLELHRKKFSGIQLRVANVKKDLEACQAQLQVSPLSTMLTQQETDLMARYIHLRRVELSIAQQKAKTANIIHNDSGTSYFYVKINERKHSQIIGEIVDHMGVIRTGLSEVADAFVKYYEHLLGTSSPVAYLDSSLIRMAPKVVNAIKVILTSPIMDLEIKKALASIDLTKSPGPDGFSSAFF
ncbi:hypothetical protein RND81_08G154500 [Saponaria officinalis]|uniref:Uncharacterized protein n=1 Tax=Saponaria officinalis TaxID=3572 RepID=A0AAW1J9B7_SAPOF